MAAAIGIIGGSGLYEIEGFEKAEERVVETPFGSPSDALVGGSLGGREVWFLPRHGRGHRLLPTEINHRANLWALRDAGVRFLICVTAVGSLKEAYRPRDIVLPDQYFDRTSRREQHTFFGRGIVGHVSFGDPVSAGLRGILKAASQPEAVAVHDGGTYVNMDGPAFSTRAESEGNRQLGFDVVGMTNLPEAKLAREAEIALATLAMITDYDCWKTDEAPVTAEAVMGHLQANVAAAKRIIARAVPEIPVEAEWPEHRSLDGAIMTPRTAWPEESVRMLAPILQRFL
ncbi:MAG: S-methyl-5'-thioadenosine phosphorylase [Verrucomicrobia bacterium]|nr:MAG: S-methyl-5'-thioadenosine phosphorylase [Verrucomicrobiota bacterium]TAE87494.1 MAG: S-methyl-5'-thioadenosine phosphorylase [Verrucomicrobiota bacterium]TAF25776.1 MAG: S-methyl-5'-thioadenosine phosphorylase [Verrucomicrobiota bacterium]TAF41564.1 MAG: S-methyl-5'-thioadenosine phosphorylase [Verrucomicrobiota bacterium]